MGVVEMKHVHEAAAYDKWFRAEIEAAIVEADDPKTKWVPNEDANNSWAIKRAELLERVGNTQSKFKTGDYDIVVDMTISV
jgi:hypothetical protein